MGKTEKKQSGDAGEKVAAKYLAERGYQILDLNFQNHLGRQIGEIDIIARDGENGEIVFVEVKTRDLERYGETVPEENITPQKLKKLAKIASVYLRLKNWQTLPYRFDAVSVWLDLVSKQAKVKHIKYL